MNPSFFRQVETHLNPERLDAYRQDGASEVVTLARYLLNMALCESLYSPLQIVEITLRNAFHESLKERAGKSDWYNWEQLPLWQESQIREAKQRLLKEGKECSAGRIVAEQTFGFWVGFLTREHMTSGLAYHIAKTAFSHAPKSERNVRSLASRLQRIRDFRNRVFHHERILHWKDLDAQHEQILDVIGWISPELCEMANALDRFISVRSLGLGPYIEKLQCYWPAS
jgi:hypothetical protein